MKGLMDCPYHAAIEVVGTQNEELKRLDLTEDQIRKAPVVGQKGGPQLMVSKENMVAALKMDVAQMVDWQWCNGWADGGPRQ